MKEPKLFTRSWISTAFIRVLRFWHRPEGSCRGLAQGSWPHHAFLRMNRFDERAFQIRRAGLALHLFRRRAANQPAFVHQSHAIASLGFVQKRRGRSEEHTSE